MRHALYRRVALLTHQDSFEQIPDLPQILLEVETELAAIAVELISVIAIVVRLS